MKHTAFIIIALTLLSACNPNQKWTRKAIEGKEQKMEEMNKQGKVDTTEIKDLLQAYEGYADSYPGDTAGASYLFKAANFYRYLHKPARSIEIYRRIYNNYPIFENRPYALFLQGFTFENEMGKIDSAKVIYEDFLAKYPHDPFSKDVQITLANLGKSPEDLIKEFEAKQQADSLAKTQ